MYCSTFPRFPAIAALHHLTYVEVEHRSNRGCRSWGDQLNIVGLNADIVDSTDGFNYFLYLITNTIDRYKLFSQFILSRNE